MHEPVFHRKSILRNLGTKGKNFLRSSSVLFCYEKPVLAASK